MSIKSQFVGGTCSEAGTYLLTSLSLIGEDTRGGLSASAQTSLKSMESYVAANPDKTNAENFRAYAAKLSSAEASKPAQARVVKPTTGMMG